MGFDSIVIWVLSGAAPVECSRTPPRANLIWKNLRPAHDVEDYFFFSHLTSQRLGERKKINYILWEPSEE